MSYSINKNKNDLFIKLCQDYHEKIFKYLYFNLNDAEDAKDLTQEVFIIVYNRINKSEFHENWGGFIYQTAKFTAANLKRKAIKKSYMEQNLEGDEIKAQFVDVYDEIEATNDKNIDENNYIGNVLEGLSVEKQKLYQLRFVEQRPYKEIAEHLKIKEVNLRMKYVRLRRDIKQIVRYIAKENFNDM